MVSWVSKVDQGKKENWETSNNMVMAPRLTDVNGGSV